MLVRVGADKPVERNFGPGCAGRSRSARLSRAGIHVRRGAARGCSSLELAAGAHVVIARQYLPLVGLARLQSGELQGMVSGAAGIIGVLPVAAPGHAVTGRTPIM